MPFFSTLRPHISGTIKVHKLPQCILVWIGLDFEIVYEKILEIRDEKRHPLKLAIFEIRR